MRSCGVEELKARLDRGGCRILDVREPAEFTAERIEGSRLLPLSALREDPRLAAGEGEVLLVCRTGRRAREAAALLAARGGDPIVVEGGVQAWKQAAYPVLRGRGAISLERQVRIAAGLLVLGGLLVPGLRFLPYLVGAGLVLAGVTDSCAMGMLLARMSWNRVRKSAAADAAGAGAGSTEPEQLRGKRVS